jgi:hypothetical protein
MLYSFVQDILVARTDWRQRSSLPQSAPAVIGGASVATLLVALIVPTRRSKTQANHEP